MSGRSGRRLQTSRAPVAPCGGRVSRTSRCSFIVFCQVKSCQCNFITMSMKLPALLFTLLVLRQSANLLPAEGAVNVVDENNEDGVNSMSYIGLALEAAYGCDDRNFYMQRLIGMQPKLENYYDATVDVGDGTKEGDMYMKIEFFSSANIIIEPSAARVDHLEGNTYLMTIPGNKKQVKFTVRADSGQPFPSVKLLELDGKPLCKLIEWNPTLLGPSANAISHAVLPPSTVIPYCGRKQVIHTALVTKGDLTKEGDWPWHAALYRSNENRTGWRYLCGATIVSRTALVTAAHCTLSQGQPLKAHQFKVVLGKYNLDSTLDHHAVEIGVKEVVVHENFVTENLENDVAILKVCEGINYSDYVQPICLWDANRLSKEILYGEFGSVVGWGANEFDELSERLTVGAMRVVPDGVCVKSLPSFFSRFLNERSFCAGNGPRNGTSACNGDSGSGFVFPVKQADGLNTWYLRGVVSLSVRRADSDRCDPNHYVLLTDTAAFLAWIKKEAENNIRTNLYTTTAEHLSGSRASFIRQLEFPISERVNARGRSPKHDTRELIEPFKFTKNSAKRTPYICGIKKCNQLRDIGHLLSKVVDK